MSNIEDRLRAADPAAGRVYAHPDLEAMVSRIMTASAEQPNAQWRRFKLRMASAVAVTSVVMVGAVTALQGAGPSLPVLQLGLARSGTAASPSSTAMMVYERFVFTAGAGLSGVPSLATAYQLQVPQDSSSEAERLASMFAVNATPIDVNGDGTDWSVTDPAGDNVEYQFYGGVANWYYTSGSVNSTSVTSSPPSSPPGATSGAAAGGPVPSHSTLEGDASGLMKKLGYGYTLANPSFSSNAVTSGSGTINEETVSYDVVVDGVTTDQTAQITVDSSNNIVDASGPAFTVASSANYPLQSPVDGVAVLNTEQQDRFSGVSGTAVAPSSGATGTAPSSGATPATPSPAPSRGAPGQSTTTTLPPGPPIVDVVLDGVTLTLGTYQLQDGTAWLIPVYQYTGTATAVDGNSYTGDWSTIAVDPSYVHLEQRVSPGIINY